MKVITSKFYKVSGLTLLLSGSLLLAFSLKMYSDPLQDIADLNAKKVSDIRSCNVTFSSLNYSSDVNSSSGVIVFKKPGISNWELDISTSSYAIESCKNMELVEYCFGTECFDDKKIKERGIFIKLKHINKAND